jgi:penicillin-binding protein 1C
LQKPAIHTQKRKSIFIITAATIVIILIMIRIAAAFVAFNDPFSTVVFDRNGRLLGARIAADGQWRFPQSQLIPDKYRECLLLFEDRHFYLHPGFNPVSLLRAGYKNFHSGRVISGGSTITMQTVRLSRRGKPRTMGEKVIEIILATGIELKYSKNEILNMYVSHAPFGGNVVGLDAASWRYFGRSATDLSWAEAAMLAVLPNSPALIHPGRNRDALQQKRNRLLRKLFDLGKIDKLTLDLSMEEKLPEKPLPLPETAFHLTANAGLTSKSKIVHSTIDAVFQEKCNAIIARHIKTLKQNKIFHAAMIVADNHSGEILVYIGNHLPKNITRFGSHVDVAAKPRSGGSILKPLLYAAMLETGEILPGALVADVPTTISGYSPKNFNLSYDGAVSADEALIRSLNVPAVRMLKSYGVDRFYQKLKTAGIGTLTRPSDHYGLSLILGGCEVTLWDMVKIYSGMAFQLQNCSSSIVENVSLPYPEIFWDKKMKTTRKSLPGVFDAGAVYSMFEAMKKVTRPEAEAGWEYFEGSPDIAWKTGTSFGHRDAWAIGVTPGYTVGIWIGNADGEGRPGLTGIKAAAPVMFEVFNILPKSETFFTPHNCLTEISVCCHSGKRTSPACPESTTVLAPIAGLESEMCSWHHIIHLDSNENYRVHADCYPQHLIKKKSWFILPPAMAWYYRAKNPFYKTPPNWKDRCRQYNDNPMQLIWPENHHRIYIPLEADGNRGKVVFEIAHHHPEKTAFWYVDDHFVGETTYQHKMSLRSAPGQYRLVVVDEDGSFLNTTFTVISRKHTY